MSAAPPHVTLAHAKLNLSLRVLAREAGGFHQIETLFCLIELADEIEIAVRGASVQLDVVGPPEEGGVTPDVGPLEHNLALRAAVLFAERTRAPAGAQVRLTKRIPAGAGLGGGSSDAAAVLTALNALHRTPLSLTQLLELGGQLGSDVPFFLTRAALALAWCRGTRMTPLLPPPSAPVLLAIPDARIATADAYAAIAAARDDGFVAAPALLDTRLHHWAQLDRSAYNDFEDVVFQRLPLLAILRADMAAHGALLARMSGTGSTIFGLFDDVAAAEQARISLCGRHPGVRFVLTRTLETI